ncbi:MAG: relaxase/mobilization nuclease domain-containing protein [Eggerthella lenta]
MNFAWQEEHVFEDIAAAPVGFDWAASMDATRHACGNDTPYRGKPARTFKHFVLSPDPQDGLSTGQVAELAGFWALKHFADFEVAIVLHDDNENRIPHAHIVVNNTNLVTERRLQTPDPLELNRSLQELAEERGLRFMRDEIVRECEEGPARKKTPATMQKTYIRRAEKEIASEGGYSWVSDIRSRVTVAKALARNEDEFMAVLATLEVDVSQNSEKSWRRDWIYSLADHPTWRIGGEKLGLSFGQEALRRRFGRIAAWRPTPAASREVLSHAAEAIGLNDLAELGRLSAAIETCMAVNAHSIADLDRRIARLESHGEGDSRERASSLREVREYVAQNRLLPKTVQTRRPKEEKSGETPVKRRARSVGAGKLRRGRPGSEIGGRSDEGGDRLRAARRGVRHRPFHRGAAVLGKEHARRLHARVRGCREERPLAYATATPRTKATEPTARMFPRHGARRAGGSSWQAPKRPVSSRASRWTARRCSRECSAN